MRKSAFGEGSWLKVGEDTQPWPTLGFAGRLSAAILEWSGRADFSCTETSAPEGVVFRGDTSDADADGGTEIFVRPEEDWLTVTMSQHGSDQSFVLSARTLAAVECYLFDFFGSIIRDDEKLPVLELPMARVAKGFRRIDEGPAADGAPDSTSTDTDDADAPRYVTLLDAAGEVVVRAERGVLGVMHLAVISHLLNAEIADIQASYLSRSGDPLLSTAMVRSTGRGRRR